MLFDELKDLHGLGDEERWMLDCGSLLHDIGWSLPEVPHHRASMELILNDQDLPFSIRERYMIASIARYHRKALPKEEHFHYRKLEEEDRKKVSVLSSLLRIADGLDCSHSSIVKDLEVNIEKERIRILCKVNEGPFWEEEKVNDKKKDLFVKVFGKDIVLAWERI
jgi:exopolyphosphatase/guanosine-5'-triphosphate,3'-diphosphate pyrophosphatase